MTKEITKSIIIQEIENKFKLREFEPEVFAFSERVVPVYNIEQHLIDEKVEFTEKSITSATYFSFFYVPKDERWLLNRYDVIFMAAGAYAVTGVFIRRAKHSMIDSMYLDMTEGQTVSYHIDLVKPVTLSPGDIILVLVDSYTSTAALRLYIDYSVEKLR